MTSAKPILLLSLVLSLLAFSYCPVFAQKGKKIDILSTDILTADNSIEKGAQRLLGNVKLRHGSTIMHCDSAILYARNLLRAFGNVHIEKDDSLHLYGDSLSYDGNSKFAKMRGAVKLIDNETTLTTRFLDFDMKSNVGKYFDGGRITSEKNENVLTSRIGHYYADFQNFYFRYNVLLENKEYRVESDTLRYNTSTEVAYMFGPSTIITDTTTIYCENGWYNTLSEQAQFSQNATITTKEQVLEGDSITYDGQQGIGQGFCNVVLTDTTNDFILKGDYGIYYDKKEQALVTGNALLIQQFKDDTLYLHADTITQATDQVTQLLTLRGFHHVRYFKEDLQGKCDSIVFAELDSTIEMFGSPVIWSNENQLTAERVVMRTYDGIIEKLDLVNLAFIISEEDSTAYNQIKGKNMTAYFSENEMYKIFVEGNGQTLYYAAEEDGNLIGLNKAECSNIMIYVSDSEIQRLTFLAKPTATLYPANSLGEVQTILDGFRWEPDGRPMHKLDVFRR